MLQALQPSLERVRTELERDFLGRQRAFLVGLCAERVEKSVLYLRAQVAPGSPAQAQRAARRIGELLSRELGTAMEVRILSGRARSSPAAAVEPVIDQGNETANKVLVAIEQGRAHHLNPVLLYGPKGTGKTFLVRALLRRLRSPRSLVTAQQFQTGLARARRALTVPAWRRALLDTKVFVLDEVHRLGGKTRTAHELATLLDELRARRVQVLLLSRHHPKDIWNLERGLRSRLLAGFTVKIWAPCGRESPPVTGNDATVAELVERVSSGFAVMPSEILGKRRSRRLTESRQVVVFLARRAGISGSEMARRLGWRSPSAATYAVQRVERRLREDDEFRRQVAACERAGPILASS